jgi:hypothetical protein
MHSSGAKLVPFGNALLLRFMLEHYRAGNFWNRWIGSLADKLAEIYIDHRTYAEQVSETLSEGVDEIYCSLNTYGENVSQIASFARDVVNYIGDKDRSVSIIVGGPNEPMEHMSVETYERFISGIRDGINSSKYANRVTLAAGGDSCNKRSFYSAIFKDLVNMVDAYSFHTSNDGNISNTRWILTNAPKNKTLINSEHFLYDAVLSKGYDDITVASTYVQHLKLLEETPRVRSTYLQLPIIWQESGRYAQLGLRQQNEQLVITKITKTYQKVESWYKLPEIPVSVPPIAVDEEGRPAFIPLDDWKLVVSWAAYYEIDPYLYGSIGKHETQWGRAGMGKQGWYLGYGCPRSGFCYEKFRGLVNQLRYAGYQIRRDFVFPVTLESITNFGVTSWRPANPYSWAKGVWRVYEAMGRKWIPPALGAPRLPGPSWLGMIALSGIIPFFLQDN